MGIFSFSVMPSKSRIMCLCSLFGSSFLDGQILAYIRVLEAHFAYERHVVVITLESVWSEISWSGLSEIGQSFLIQLLELLIRALEQLLVVTALKVREECRSVVWVCWVVCVPPEVETLLADSLHVSHILLCVFVQVSIQAACSLFQLV